MATIETRVRRDGKTSHRAKIRLKGARTISASFPRLTDARKWAQQTEVEIQQGRYFKDAAAKQKTLAEAIDRYLLEVMPRKPSSAKDQVRQLKWWRKRLGHLSLADVSASSIATERATLMAERKTGQRPRGSATANRYLAALSHVFTVAIREWEWLETNPVSRLAKLKEPPGRDYFLSEDECKSLLDACRASWNKDLYTVVVLAVSTGMRRSEILSLKHEQVDLDRGFLYLYETKNGDRRGVPLTGHARDLLGERVGMVPGAGALLFPSTKGPTPFDIRKPWYAALKAAKLNGFRFHDLRHSAASFLAKGGASLPEIGAIIGHRTPAMTKRYAHFANSHLHEVVSSMNRSLFPEV